MRAFVYTAQYHEYGYIIDIYTCILSFHNSLIVLSPRVSQPLLSCSLIGSTFLT